MIKCILYAILVFYIQFLWRMFILPTEAVCSGLDKRNLLESNRGWPKIDCFSPWLPWHRPPALLVWREHTVLIWSAPLPLSITIWFSPGFYPALHQSDHMPRPGNSDAHVPCLSDGLRDGAKPGFSEASL